MRKSSLSAGIALSIFSLSVQAQVSDTLLAVRNAALTTRFSVHTNGGLYAGGVYDGGLTTPPVVSGAGTRLLWYPEKAAFRAGIVYGSNWDDALIGGYSLAVGEDVRASADYSVALGKLCQAQQVSAFAVGEQNTASGAASVAMGYHAHTNARQGSFVFADRSSIDTLRAGVNHSSNWRVSGGFRIFTASNLTTGVTMQSGASVSNWGQSNAVISTSTGAMLTTGGVWQNASDVHRKHLFETISGEEVLQKLSRIPIQRWGYLNEDDQVRHIGPTAQDFYAAYGLGSDEKSIGTVDADGVALVSIQALEKRTKEQAAALQKMEAENASLNKRLQALELQFNKQEAGFSWILWPVLAAALVVVFFIRRRRTA